MPVLASNRTIRPLRLGRPRSGVVEKAGAHLDREPFRGRARRRSSRPPHRYASPGIAMERIGGITTRPPPPAPQRHFDICDRRLSERDAGASSASVSERSCPDGRPPRRGLAGAIRAEEPHVDVAAGDHDGDALAERLEAGLSSARSRRPAPSATHPPCMKRSRIAPRCPSPEIRRPGRPARGPWRKVSGSRGRCRRPGNRRASAPRSPRPAGRQRGSAASPRRAPWLHADDRGGRDGPI